VTQDDTLAVTGPGCGTGLAERMAAVDWSRIAGDLDQYGCATLGQILTAAQCAALVQTYDSPAGFRKRVVMARHGYGSGEYKYFDYPLPAAVETLRTALYPPLARIANRWNGIMGLVPPYPGDHQAYLDLCHRAGQTRATPLLLKYRAGDYNRLHRDLYGDLVFPLQAVFLLSQPGTDFTGGEFVLTEQRPRMQSRAEVVPLERGEGLVFAVNQRPQRGTRGHHRVAMRHGVSRLRSGERHTLGIIFHDAA